MGTIRNRERTRETVLAAAAQEFCEKGFDGATTAGVARRAGVSKQLINHHFGSKEALFREVHQLRFRPGMTWEEPIPDDPRDLIVERFMRRAEDVDYIRFLTWEAASGQARRVPGRAGRQRRLADYGQALKQLQDDGRLPNDIDHRMLQLAILSLATYPIAFPQITLLVTGRSAAGTRFRADWQACLRWIGQRILQVDALPVPGPKPALEAPARARPKARKPAAPRRTRAADS
jgi:AcrR family transcriptional regulator